ncbi:MAG: hypothetical protein AB8B93_17365 [Pseudomonadales bacterium]
MKTSNPVQALAVALAILLSATAALATPALAAAFTIQCKQFNCGTVSAVAKVSLLNTAPDPLPLVDPGASQTVTLEWSSSLALRSSYSLCLTSSLGSAPAAADPCFNLPQARTIHSGLSGITYEDTLTVPASARRPSASFYVKSTGKIHLQGATPPTATSNLVPFEWPLKLANLYTHNPKPRLSAGILEIEQKLSNLGADDAAPSTTDYQVAFCDGAVNLPLIDPEDPESDRLCNSDSEGFIKQNATSEPFNWIAVGASETRRTDISAMLPDPSRYPAGLWISITATADARGDVDESNELDNVRLETRYIMP